MSIPIHIPNLKSISRKTVEKSPENYIFTKGNNSCKSRLSVMKLKVDLYYVNANSYTKFRVNISEDCREKYPLKLLNGIWQNLSLPGSKISTSSAKFVFFGLIGRTICPRPLVGWDIFDFSSESDQWNLTKLDMKHGRGGGRGVGAGVDRKTKIAARPLIDRGTDIVPLDYIVS